MSPSNKIPSLGDDGKEKLHIVYEERPLPTSRKEKVAVFEDILNLGGVQKIVIEVGTPIKITRLTKVDLSPPDSIRDEDVFSNIRNSEIRELLRPEQTQFHRYLFEAFSVLTQERLRPRVFMVNDVQRLRDSLDVDQVWNLSELFGVEILKSKEVPNDVLLLAAAKAFEDDIVLTLKMLMHPARK